MLGNLGIYKGVTPSMLISYNWTKIAKTVAMLTNFMIV